MVKFAKKKQKQSDDFTLEDVLEKGGNTEDYNLLRDLEHDGKNKIQSKEDNIRVSGFSGCLTANVWVFSFYYCTRIRYRCGILVLCVLCYAD